MNMRAPAFVGLVLTCCSLAASCSVEDYPGPHATFSAPEAIDLLVMVDDSVAGQGQRELALALPVLLEALRSLPGGRPDLQLMVVKSDLGAEIAPQPTCAAGMSPGAPEGFGCGLRRGQRFLSLTRDQPLSPAISDQLACLVRGAGRRGCGYGHQLGSVVELLEADALAAGPGFLRPEAHLVILIVTDDDDCSTAPSGDRFLRQMPADQTAATRCALAGHTCFGAPPPAAEFKVPLSVCRGTDGGPLFPIPTLIARLLARKRGGEANLTIAGIFGKPAAHPDVPYQIERTPRGLDYVSSCRSRLGTASLAPRLATFLEALGPSGLSEDICVDELTPALTRVGEGVVRRLTSQCVGGGRNCWLHANNLRVPHCGEGAREPCWRFESTPFCGSQVTVQSAGRFPAGTTFSLACNGLVE